MGRLAPVLLSSVSRVWPSVHRLFAPTIARTHGEANSETIFDSLVRGETQLWVYGDPPAMAAITKMVTYATGRKTAIVQYLGGEGLYKCIDKMADIELWAAFNNCSAVEIEEGREEFKRVLPGYEIAGIHYIKELPNG